MAKQGVKSTGARRAAGPARPGQPPKVPATVAAASAPVVKKPPFDPARFFREVRQEARNVTWTSWRETWITSVMVLIMVTLTGIFFYAVDQALGLGMQYLLKLAAS